MKKLLLASGLFALLAVGCNVQPTNIIPANPATSSSSVNANTSNSTQTQTPTNPITVNGNIKTYTSPKLGVSFRFSDPNVSVKEVGNKIYVYASAMKPEEGQSVEIWNKPANQSLSDAIRANFLTKSPAKCVVSIEPASKFGVSNFQVATITSTTLQNDPNGSVEDLFSEIEGCPENYSITNGARYFAMDPKHPAKFMFFSIGQYGIAGDTAETGWQDTLTVQ